MLLPGRIYIARGPLALRGFLQHLLAKYKRRPKKVLLSERGGPGTVPYDKYGAGYCITSIKRLDEGLRKQLLEQKPLISPWLYV